MNSDADGNMPAAPIYYDEIRGRLFQSIFLRSGISVFNEYWNGFKSFILGRISKLEFDEVMGRSLTVEEVQMHNHLVSLVLTNIHAPVEDRSARWKFPFTQKIFAEMKEAIDKPVRVPSSSSSGGNKRARSNSIGSKKSKANGATSISNEMPTQEILLAASANIVVPPEAQATTAAGTASVVISAPVPKAKAPRNKQTAVKVTLPDATPKVKQPAQLVGVNNTTTTTTTTTPPLTVSVPSHPLSLMPPLAQTPTSSSMGPPMAMSTSPSMRGNSSPQRSGHRKAPLPNPYADPDINVYLQQQQYQYQANAATMSNAQQGLTTAYPGGPASVGGMNNSLTSTSTFTSAPSPNTAGMVMTTTTPAVPGSTPAMSAQHAASATLMQQLVSAPLHAGAGSTTPASAGASGTPLNSSEMQSNNSNALASLSVPGQGATKPMTVTITMPHAHAYSPRTPQLNVIGPPGGQCSRVKRRRLTSTHAVSSDTLQHLGELSANAKLSSSSSKSSNAPIQVHIPPQSYVTGTARATSFPPQNVGQQQQQQQKVLVPNNVGYSQVNSALNNNTSMSHLNAAEGFPTQFNSMNTNATGAAVMRSSASTNAGVISYGARTAVTIQNVSSNNNQIHGQGQGQGQQYVSAHSGYVNSSGIGISQNQTQMGAIHTGQDPGILNSNISMNNMNNGGGHLSAGNTQFAYSAPLQIQAQAQANTHAHANAQLQHMQLPPVPSMASSSFPPSSVQSNQLSAGSGLVPVPGHGHGHGADNSNLSGGHFNVDLSGGNTLLLSNMNSFGSSSNSSSSSSSSINSSINTGFNSNSSSGGSQLQSEHQYSGPISSGHYTGAGGYNPGVTTTNMDPSISNNSSGIGIASGNSISTVGGNIIGSIGGNNFAMHPSTGTDGGPGGAIVQNVMGSSYSNLHQHQHQHHPQQHQQHPQQYQQQQQQQQQQLSSNTLGHGNDSVSLTNANKVTRVYGKLQQLQSHREHQQKQYKMLHKSSSNLPHPHTAFIGADNNPYSNNNNNRNGNGVTNSMGSVSNIHTQSLAQQQMQEQQQQQVNVGHMNANGNTVQQYNLMTSNMQIPVATGSADSHDSFMHVQVSTDAASDAVAGNASVKNRTSGGGGRGRGRGRGRGSVSVDAS